MRNREIVKKRKFDRVIRLNVLVVEKNNDYLRNEHIE